jgi:hypothetical protein
MHSLALGRLVLDPNFRSVFAKDGVLVFERVGAVRALCPASRPRPRSPSPGALRPPADRGRDPAQVRPVRPHATS